MLYKSVTQYIFLDDVVIGPHPALFEPASFQNNPPKYYATLAYRNDHFSNVQLMAEALDKNKAHVKQLTPQMDVDTITNSLDRTGDGPDGYIKLRARSGEAWPPQLLHADAITICKPGDLYSGVIVRAKIEVKVYQDARTKALNTFYRLLGLQKIADASLPAQLIERVGPNFTPIKVPLAKTA